MTGVADLLDLVYAALPALDGWRTVAVPPASTGTPAMWLEHRAGGGPVGSNVLGIALTVRVVAVPRPQPAAAQYSVTGPLVDALNASLRPLAVPGGAVTHASYVIDRVVLGEVDHTAVLYDLTLTHHPTC